MIVIVAVPLHHTCDDDGRLDHAHCRRDAPDLSAVVHLRRRPPSGARRVTGHQARPPVRPDVEGRAHRRGPRRLSGAVSRHRPAHRPRVPRGRRGRRGHLQRGGGGRRRAGPQPREPAHEGRAGPPVLQGALQRPAGARRIPRRGARGRGGGRREVASALAAAVSTALHAAYAEVYLGGRLAARVAVESGHRDGDRRAARRPARGCGAGRAARAVGGRGRRRGGDRTRFADAPAGPGEATHVGPPPGFAPGGAGARRARARERGRAADGARPSARLARPRRQAVGGSLLGRGPRPRADSRPAGRRGRSTTRD